MKRLCCVFAHPDDEAMGPGGTIAKLAKTMPVSLICVTTGNGKTAKNSLELGKIRQKELLQSAKILGIDKVECLGYDDGELNNNLYHEIASKIEDRVKEYQADTLLTFETNGVTGHLDHIAVSLITSFVFKKLGFVRTLLYYCEKQELLEEFAKDYFIFIPEGYSDGEITLNIDISDTLELKKAAIRAHKSQQKDGERIIELHQKLNRTFESFLRLEK